MLEGVEARESPSAFSICLPKDGPLPFCEWHEAVAIGVNDANRTRKPKCLRSPHDSENSFWILCSRPEHGVGVDAKLRSLRKQAKFRLQKPETLLRSSVRLNVIDAYLQIIEAGSIELFDPLLC